MSLMRFTLTASVLLALSACAAGPDFHPKPLSTPERLSEATPQVATAQTPPDAWWRLYDDPNLDALVTEALAHNTDLRVAVANLDRARGAVWEARSALLPTTHESAQAGVGRSATANYQAALSGRDAKAGHFVTAEADAAYEIDLFGRVRRAIEAVRADAQSVEAARDAVRVSVAGETARAYASACALGEQADAEMDSLHRRSDRLATLAEKMEVSPRLYPAHRYRVLAYNLLNQANFEGLMYLRTRDSERKRRAELLRTASRKARAQAERLGEALLGRVTTGAEESGGEQ